MVERQEDWFKDWLDLIKGRTFVQQSVPYKLLRQQVDDLTSPLTAREQAVVRMRFGLDDGRPKVPTIVYSLSMI